ncbi:hypothetical protein H4R27_002708 [Coemansia aciculifera]|nr:hypothetical protein H4R27_002708 [Coemansia aciculifera]
MSLDRIRGFGSGVDIATPNEFTQQLQRNSIQPIRSLVPNTLGTILCIVSNFTPAVKSSGTDHKLVVRVADPSLPHRETVTWITFRDLHSMPSIQSPGDILYLEDVKVQEFSGKTQLLSNYGTRWEVLSIDDDVEGLNPMLKYLRDWWLSQQSRGPSAQSVPSFVEPSENIRTKYLKKVSELDDSTRYVDLLIEVLHIRDAEPAPYIRSALRCLVTDYTENHLLHDVEISTPVRGKRLLWCTINNPDDIPGMPQLQPNHYYRLRGAKVTIDRFDGLTVMVERNDKFPKTKVVNEVTGGLPELKALLERRKKYAGRLAHPRDIGSRPLLIDTTIPQQTRTVSAPAPQPTRTVPAPLPPPAPFHSRPEFMNAETTLISDITGDQQTTGTRYHIRAQIVDVYPDSAEQACISSDIRVVLEVADNSGSCLVLCQGESAAEFIGLKSRNLGDTLTKLLPIWDAAEEEESAWLDLCVASILMPGPSADGRTPLVRCLVLAGGTLK